MKVSRKVLVVFALLLCLLCNMAAGARGNKKSNKKNRKPGMPRPDETHPKGTDCNNSTVCAQIIKASHFDYEFFLGHKIVFICVAKGDPLPHIAWYKDGSEISFHPFLQISEWKISDVSLKSKLEIDPARQMDSGLYECEANNKHAVDKRAFKADFSTIT